MNVQTICTNPGAAEMRFRVDVVMSISELAQLRTTLYLAELDAKQTDRPDQVARCAAMYDALDPVHYRNNVDG
jgi:hypothetical protein